MRGDERPPTYADRVLEHRGWHRPQEPARGTSARALLGELRELALSHPDDAVADECDRAARALAGAMARGADATREAMARAVEVHHRIASGAAC